mmetsp:Transcript_17482/g.51696  ORF Transcript_17482/g.51696 Transcript_17482/m.51696 type:complete len:233 (-) Transcript_17482:89-787(-)
MSVVFIYLHTHTRGGWGGVPPLISRARSANAGAAANARIQKSDMLSPLPRRPEALHILLVLRLARLALFLGARHRPLVDLHPGRKVEARLRLGKVNLLLGVADGGGGSRALFQRSHPLHGVRVGCVVVQCLAGRQLCPRRLFAVRIGDGLVHRARYARSRGHKIEAKFQDGGEQGEEDGGQAEVENGVEDARCVLGTRGQQQRGSAAVARDRRGGSGAAAADEGGERAASGS